MDHKQNKHGRENKCGNYGIGGSKGIIEELNVGMEKRLRDPSMRAECQKIGRGEHRLYRPAATTYTDMHFAATVPRSL